MTAICHHQQFQLRKQRHPDRWWINLSHIIFADDIVLIAKSTSKLQEMFQGTHDISKAVGFKMLLEKTIVLCIKYVNKDDVIEEVNRYSYLKQMVTKDHYHVQDLKKCNLEESDRWSAFGKLDNIIQDKNVIMRLKRKVFNECILPIMTYDWDLVA